MKMFKRFYQQEDLPSNSANVFDEAVLSVDHDVSPAQIHGHFMRHKTSYISVISNVHQM